MSSHHWPSLAAAKCLYYSDSSAFARHSGRRLLCLLRFLGLVGDISDWQQSQKCSQASETLLSTLSCRLSKHSEFCSTSLSSSSSRPKLFSEYITVSAAAKPQPLVTANLQLFQLEWYMTWTSFQQYGASKLTWSDSTKASVMRKNNQ